LKTLSLQENIYRKGYTSKEYMALSGRSNGGLLVGATMTIRPDLAKSSLPGSWSIGYVEI
jgi:prolyl oligopeptidase